MLVRLQKFESTFFKWGLATLLLGVPLYPKFPVFNIPGTYVAVRAEDFIIAILLFLYLGSVLKNFKTFFSDRINQAILLFILAGLTSLISGILLTQTVLPHIGFLHWARRIEYVIPFFIAASFARRENASFFAKLLFVAAFAIFIYGLGQMMWGFPVISTQNDEFSKGLALKWVPGSRLHSTFAGHYDLSAWLVMFFPFAFAWLFLVKNWFGRIFLLLAVISPTFWILMKAESRVSFIAFLIGVSATLWVIRRKIFIVPFLIIGIVGMLTVGNLWEKYRHTVDVYKGRVIENIKINFVPNPVFAQSEVKAPERIKKSIPAPENVMVFEDRSTSIRFNVEWPRAIRALEKNPILGTGYSSITLATDSDYLRLLGEVGLLGTIGFFLILARISTLFWKYLRKSNVLDVSSAYVGGCFGAIVGFLVNATFIDVFEASKAAIVFWTICGIAIGLVTKGRLTDEKI